MPACERSTEAATLREDQALLVRHGLANRPGDKQKTITVHVAQCDVQRRLASTLVNRMYAWRGYGAEHALTADPNRVTFTACSDGAIVGTLTLGVDSADGLAADETFQSELDKFRRRPGRQLCELTKFACDSSTQSQAALAALFHVIYVYGTQRFGCTDLFIEVHPRHVRFYEVMLGFKRVGEPKLNPAITWWPSDVPAQLMWIEVAEIERLIEEHADRKTEGVRSLYPHFFSPEEERGVWSRIAALSGHDIAPDAKHMARLRTASSRTPSSANSLAA
jgi:hypothetical protein